MQLVGTSRRAAKLGLHLLESPRVDQVSKLLLAQELLQQVSIEGQGLRPPLRKRRVVFVHVSGDVVEEERGRIGRRARRLDLDEIDLPLTQCREKAFQGRQVENVLEALSVGL